MQALAPDRASEIGRLEAELGPFGFQWLCACAILPILRFPLTVHVGVALARLVARAPPTPDEHRALFQHEWFRDGKIPDPLRAQLVQAIDPRLAPPLRREIAGLLKDWSGRPPEENRGAHLAYFLADVAALPEARLSAPRDSRLARFMFGAPPPPTADTPRLLRLLKRLRAAAPVSDAALKALAPLVVALLALSVAAALIFLRPDDFTTRQKVTQAVARPRWVTTQEPRPAKPPPTPETPPKPTAAKPSPTNAPPPSRPAAGVRPPPTAIETPSGEQTPQASVQAGNWRAAASVETAYAYSVEFLPNGRQILTAGQDNVVWDADLGVQVGKLNASAIVAALSPDGRTIALPSGIYDLQSGKQMAAFDSGRFNCTRWGTYSRDGSRVAFVFKVCGGDETQVAVYAAKTGQRLWTVERPSISGIGSNTVAFSPDGARVATSSENGLELFDAKTGRLVASKAMKEARPLAFAPEGGGLAVGDDERVLILDPSSLTEIRALEASNAIALSYAPDGKTLLVGNGDGQVAIWDVATGERTTTLRERGRYISSVAFSPGGDRVAAATTDGPVQVWRLVPNRPGPPLPETPASQSTAP